MESDESGEQEKKQDEAPLEEQAGTQTCRFCAGEMKVTGRTERPRVSELLEMPLVRFREARAGLAVTLGARLPQIEAERSGGESAPVMGKPYQQIRAQLQSMVHSSYL